MNVHFGQLWVQILNENLTIKETFLCFMYVTEGRAASLIETTCKYVEDIGLAWKSSVVKVTTEQVS